MFKRLFTAFLLTCACAIGFSQGKLSIDNVHAAYLRNSGTIMENNQIKGYFFLYQSDKIDRQTNEYTLQILDQNINKVIDIKFEDSKTLSLLEAAYNNSSLAFLFKNNDNKTLDLKVYSIDGKLKYTYSRSFDKRTDDLMNRYQTLHTDEGNRVYSSFSPSISKAFFLVTKLIPTICGESLLLSFLFFFNTCRMIRLSVLPRYSALANFSSSSTGT